MLFGLTHPGGVAARAAHLAFAPFCHQRPERSFVFEGAAMCVCHRCFGIYVGIFLGAVLALLGVRADVGRRALWFGATAPMVAHVALSSLWPPADLWPLRVATGLLFGAWGGLATALALGDVFGSRAGRAALDTTSALHLREERT